jgi:1-deoxy-D-xylulose-5-phosphate synthase
MRDADVWVPLRDLGVPQDWHAHGTRAQILAAIGLTAQDISRRVTEWVSVLEDTVVPRPRVVPNGRSSR